MNNSIGRVTSILSIPYGYTVSLWSAGALTYTRQGAPSVPDVMSFVVGAVAAFVALARLGRDHLETEIPMRVPWMVVVNLFPIVAALVVLAFPVGMASRGFSYFASSFLATAAYIVSLACLVRIARGLGRRSSAPETGSKG
jgi:hypothetical protein